MIIESLGHTGAVGRVSLEEGIPDDVIDGLRQLGHEVRSHVAGFDRTLFGRGHVIERVDADDSYRELKGESAETQADADAVVVGRVSTTVKTNDATREFDVTEASPDVSFTTKTQTLPHAKPDGSSVVSATGGESDASSGFYLIGCESRSDGAPCGN